MLLKKKGGVRTVLTHTHARELEKLEGLAEEKQHLSFSCKDLGLEHGHVKNW